MRVKRERLHVAVNGSGFLYKSLVLLPTTGILRFKSSGSGFQVVVESCGGTVFVQHVVHGFDGRERQCPGRNTQMGKCPFQARLIQQNVGSGIEGEAPHCQTGGQPTGLVPGFENLDCVALPRQPDARAQAAHTSSDNNNFG